MEFEFINKRKGSIDDLPLEEREFFWMLKNPPSEIWLFDCALKGDLKDIPGEWLANFAQTALNRQDFKAVEDMINELKKRGHKVIIE